MRAVAKFGVLAICVYAAIAALVYFRQDSMVYYPDIAGRTLGATPGQLGLAYQDVELQTEDGLRLHGWFIPASDARGTLLFFHGNAGNISHRLDSIDFFNRMNLDLLIVDYRGYGQSQGRPSEAGTYRDAEAAWFYLLEQRNVDPGRIIVFGRSLGASIAAWLASRHRPGALILESSFSSVPSMAKRLYPFLPVEWLAKFDYDTARYIRGIACPVLVAHSPDDEIIPYAEGRAVFDAAPADRQFLELRGGHNDAHLVTGKTYRDAIERFVERVLP